MHDFNFVKFGCARILLRSEDSGKLILSKPDSPEPPIESRDPAFAEGVVMALKFAGYISISQHWK